MIEKFFPDIYIDNIFMLPLDELKEKNIRALVFDIDNTLAPFDHPEAGTETIGFIKFLKRQGFRIALLSNNNKKRVEKFNQKMSVHTVHKAGKPGSKKLLEALWEMGVSPKEAALVGDQVFTDVYCAHNAGTLAILTKPMCPRDQLITKVKRGAERQVLKIYEGRKNK
ncbi:MAG: YqeG family HAD IIIA-type phosphatase [Firmicutes bacterium]|nr:YqeG family HAD IIIA-type phosphatase [Bacillota bacterium]